MALIICPECGREISDRAAACIHCGFPLDLMKEGKDQNRKTNNHLSGEVMAEVVTSSAVENIFAKENVKDTAKNLKYKIQEVIESHKAVIICVLGVLLTMFVVVSAGNFKTSKAIANESISNITPYLEIIPCEVDKTTGKILLPSDLYQNKDTVEFLGIMGSVTYRKNDSGTVNKVIWQSHDFFTFDEHQEFVPLLEEVFASKATKDHYITGQWTTINYYWYDESIPCVITFYTSVRANHEKETDRIEICWDMEGKMPN